MGRVDEMYIPFQGKFSCLYRAVDKHGKTVDFLLRPDRSIAAAQAFFRKALSTSLPTWPRGTPISSATNSPVPMKSICRSGNASQHRTEQYCRPVLRHEGAVLHDVVSRLQVA